MLSSFINSFFCARPFDQKLRSALIYFFICTLPFDQKLRSSLIYFFYLHTTIRPNCRVLFHLFFLKCTTIRPKIRVHIDLFFIWTRPFDQIIGSSLIYFFCLHTTIWQKYMTFFLSFIHSLCRTIRPKNRVLINVLFLFVHDHSTKLGVTLTLLLILFLNLPIFRLLYSWQTLPLHFIRYVHSSTVYIFRSVH